MKDGIDNTLDRIFTSSRLEMAGMGQNAQVFTPQPVPASVQPITSSNLGTYVEPIGFEPVNPSEQETSDTVTARGPTGTSYLERMRTAFGMLGSDIGEKIDPFYTGEVGARLAKPLIEKAAPALTYEIDIPEKIGRLWSRNNPPEKISIIDSLSNVADIAMSVPPLAAEGRAISQSMKAASAYARANAPKVAGRVAQVAKDFPKGKEGIPFPAPKTAPGLDGMAVYDLENKSFITPQGLKSEAAEMANVLAREKGEGHDVLVEAKNILSGELDVTKYSEMPRVKYDKQKNIFEIRYDSDRFLRDQLETPESVYRADLKETVNALQKEYPSIGISIPETGDFIPAKITKPAPVDVHPKTPVKTATGAPTEPPPSKFTEMWEAGRQKQPSDSEDQWRQLWEQIHDWSFGLRKLKGEGEITPGGKSDINTLLDRTSGIANAGATRAVLAYDAVKKVAPDVHGDDISSIIFANHAKEIIAEKGSKRLIAGGFKSAQELDAGLLEIEQRLGPDKWARAQSGAQIIKDLYQTELKRLVDEGIIAKDVGDTLAAKYPWYSPLKYVADAEELAIKGKSATPYKVISSGLKRLTEEGTEKAAINPFGVLPSQLIDNEIRIHKNQLAKAIVNLGLEEKLPIKKVKLSRPVAQVGDEVIYRPIKDDIPGTLSFYENGARQVYEVPEWIAREADMLTKVSNNPAVALIGQLNGVSRAAFTSFSPGFVVGNMLNDSVSALIKAGVLPYQTGLRLIQSLKGIENDKVMQAFRLSGGYQVRYYGRDLAKEVIANGGKVFDSKKSFLKQIAGVIPAAGEAGEQAPRMTAFKNYLNKNLPNWALMTPEQIAASPQGRKAAAEAINATINFARGGYFFKSANPMLLFLNANMEGMKLPFRALKESPAARWRLAGAGAAVTGLTAYNLSYPEYFDVPNDIRWGSVVVMLPSNEVDQYGNKKPNYLTIIPRTREWALFFGPMTYAMERMFTDTPTEFGKFSATLGPMLSPISEIPAAPVIQEAFAQKANWDFYHSQPIVPTDLENKPPEEQVQSWVSPTIAKLADAFKVSPLRVQHAYSGLFGGAGRGITSLTDWITSLISPPDVDPHISLLKEQLENIPDAETKQRFLSNLDYKDRDKLYDLMRQPQKGIPIVSAVTARVKPNRGGQLYRTGQEKAQEKTGISPEQTQAAGRILRDVSDEITIKQEQIDDALKSATITMPEWREIHKEQGTLYRGALISVGVLLPDAAQAQKDSQSWTEYTKTVNTLASTMPDRRTKGDLLIAAWRSFQPVELSPGKMDWDSFFKQRDEFKKALNPEERSVLDERLKADMTRLEKAYYDAQQNDKIGDYFALEEGTPRDVFRVNNPDLDASLNLMGIATSIKSPKALEIVRKQADQNGLPYRVFPGLGEGYIDRDGTEVYKKRDVSTTGLWKTLTFMPEYYREYLWETGGWDNPSLSSSISRIAQAKSSDKKMLEEYESLNPAVRERYRRDNPDVDVALNLWGMVSTVMSAQAMQMLRDRAQSLDIPFEALPISPQYKRNQMFKKREAIMNNLPSSVGGGDGGNSVNFISDKLKAYGIR